MSAPANSTTPVNSLTRRDSADSAKVLSSDFQHDGQDERPSSEPFPEHALHLLPNTFLQEPRIRPLLERRLVMARVSASGASRSAAS